MIQLRISFCNTNGKHIPSKQNVQFFLMRYYIIFHHLATFISPNRLIFKVLGKLKVECTLDDEYFLTNRMSQLAMIGIQGRTIISMEERQWMIEMVKNQSFCGVLNGTTMYPNGLQTISNTDNDDASLQLKLSNVGFL